MLEKLGSFEYTRQTLEQLDRDARAEVPYNIESNNYIRAIPYVPFTDGNDCHYFIHSEIASDFSLK